MSLYGRINAMAQNQPTEQQNLFRDAMRKRITRDEKNWSNQWTCGQLAQVAAHNTPEEEIIGIAAMLFT